MQPNDSNLIPMKSGKLLLNIFFSVTLILLTFSCERSERNLQMREYKKLRVSNEYKKYKRLSRRTITPTLKIYNLTRGKRNPKVDESVIRLFLGYTWAVSQKPTYALAEANIIRDKVSDRNNEYVLLSHFLTSIALYEKEWKILAREEIEEGITLNNLNPEGYTKEKITVFHLIIGSAHMYQKDLETALFHFKSLANETSIDWPYFIIDAMIDLEKGETVNGLKKLENLVEAGKIPERVSEIVEEGLKDYKNNNGEVDSFVFWPKAISYIIFDNLRIATEKGIGRISGLIDKFHILLDK